MATCYFVYAALSPDCADDLADTMLIAQPAITRVAIYYYLSQSRSPACFLLYVVH